MAVSANTRLVALFGHPVSHSLSPAIHNSGFQGCDLDMIYLTFDVSPRGLGDAVKSIKTLGIAGANITIPHKENVIFFLDRLTPRAEAVGAVNTIVRREAENDEVVLEGDNTDVPGFTRSLTDHAAALAENEALVWGSGGVARAVVYALLEEMDLRRIHLVCRTPERGEAIVDSIEKGESRISVVGWDYAPLAMQKATLLVNATPLGMTPHTDASPCRHPDLIRKDHIVFDLVYNPEQTRLLDQAVAAGAQCVGGLEMLIQQAAESFHAWTGQQMSLDAVRIALRDALQEG